MLMLEFTTEKEAIESSNKVFAARREAGIVDMCCGGEASHQITTEWGTPMQLGEKWYIIFPDFAYDTKTLIQTEKDFPESVEESKEYSLEITKVGK
jgi:hypothetical protein